MNDLCSRLGQHEQYGSGKSKIEKANAAYALARMPYTEKLFNTIIDNERRWTIALEQDPLPEVFESFLKIQAAVKYLVRRCETSSQEAFKRRFKRFKATIQQLTIRRQEDEESEEEPSSEAIKAEDQQ